MMLCMPAMPMPSPSGISGRAASRSMLAFPPLQGSATGARYREILVTGKMHGFCAEPILEDRFPCPLQPAKKRPFGENTNQ